MRRFGLLWVAPAACLVVVAAVVAGVIAFDRPVAGVHADPQVVASIPAVGARDAAGGGGTPGSAPAVANSGAGSGSGGRYAPLPGQPLSLSVPAVGLVARVGAMARPTSGDIDPPTSSAAYWISSYGTVGPGSDNTAYIAGHTCRGVGCRAVFQPFLDVPHSATTVHPGDKVTVTSPSGTWDYTVTGTQKYSKETIASDQKLWQKVPGRLVLVCCFQYQGGTSSQQNYIVYAQLDPGQQ